jgi:hypothetical protein
MNKKIIIAASSALLLALPVAALAFSAGPTPNSVVLSVPQIIDLVLNFIWPIFGGFAVIMFLLAGFLFLTSQGDAAKVAQARQAVLWGVVGVVVGLIAFSIPLIVRVTLGNGI